MTTRSAGNERLTVAALGAVGFLMFLLMAGIAGWTAWSRYDHAQSWTPVTVTVEKVEQLCDLQHKSGKSWGTEATMSCTEADRLVQERNGVMTQWRAVRMDYATIAYEAAGATQRQLLRVAAIADGPLAPGDQRPMMVNPADPAQVDQPFSATDMRRFWTLSGLGLAIWIGVTALGWIIAKLNSRWRSAGPAAVAGVPAVGLSGGLSTGGTTAGAVAVPVWSKLLRWTGIAVLIIGTLVALIAMASSLSSGDSSAMVGAGVIFILTLIVWSIVSLVARRGARGHATRLAGRV